MSEKKTGLIIAKYTVLQSLKSCDELKKKKKKKLNSGNTLLSVSHN